MQRACPQRRVGALAEVERLDQLQRLRHRRAARRRRTHAADLVSAIAGAQRRALLHLIVLEIVERHAAGSDRGRRYCIDDGLRDRPFVKGVSATRGDGPQRRGELRILEPVTDGERAAAIGEEVAPRRRHEARRAIETQQKVQALRYLEAVVGDADRRLEQLRPRQLAVLLVHVLQQPHEARDADAEPRQNSVVEGHRLAVDEKAVGARRRRRRFAAVVDLQLGLCLVPIENEGAATEPARLRLDEVEHELRGDRRVDGRAAGAQHLAAGFGGEGVGGRHHVTLAPSPARACPTRSRLPAALRGSSSCAWAGPSDTKANKRPATHAALCSFGRGGMGTGRCGQLFTNFRHHGTEHNGRWKDAACRARDRTYGRWPQCCCLPRCSLPAPIAAPRARPLHRCSAPRRRCSASPSSTRPRRRRKLPRPSSPCSPARKPAGTSTTCRCSATSSRAR